MITISPKHQLVFDDDYDVDVDKTEEPLIVLSLCQISRVYINENTRSFILIELPNSQENWFPAVQNSLTFFLTVEYSLNIMKMLAVSLL